MNWLSRRYIQGKNKKKNRKIKEQFPFKLAIGNFEIKSDKE
jgi:hypothetical protein